VPLSSSIFFVIDSELPITPSSLSAFRAAPRRSGSARSWPCDQILWLGRARRQTVPQIAVRTDVIGRTLVMTAWQRCRWWMLLDLARDVSAALDESSRPAVALDPARVDRSGDISRSPPVARIGASSSTIPWHVCIAQHQWAWSPIRRIAHVTPIRSYDAQSASQGSGHHGQERADPDRRGAARKARQARRRDRQLRSRFTKKIDEDRARSPPVNDPRSPTTSSRSPTTPRLPRHAVRAQGVRRAAQRVQRVRQAGRHYVTVELHTRPTSST